MNTFDLRKFVPTRIPQYAIASHRWCQDEDELSLDAIKGKHEGYQTKKGYMKLEGFVDFVKSHLQHIEWLWIDTCCINRNSDAELSESINSMYKWYANAEVCLAYLADVEARDLNSFKQSEWFLRGWTLQELLAPRTVVFLARDWTILGHKGTGRCKGGIDLTCGPSLTASLVATT